MPGIQEILGLLDEVLSDEAARTLVSNRRVRLMQLTLEKFSSISPRVLNADITGDGTTKSFSVPTLWEPKFSQIRSVEYPKGKIPPIFLDSSDYTVHFIDNAYKIMFVFAPASGEIAHLTFTTRHSLTMTGDSFTNSERNAFTFLSAGFICRYLASTYTQSVSSTLGADAVNWADKQNQYLVLAREYRQQCYEALGLTPPEDEETKPTAMWLDLDTQLPFQQDYLLPIHWGRRR